MSRELLCERCDHEYDVWSAPNTLWNRIAAAWHFLCFYCFIDIYRKDDMDSKKITRVRPDGSTEEDSVESRQEGGINWPEQIVAPVEPMDSRRPTLSESWAALGRTEPYGA